MYAQADRPHFPGLESIALCREAEGLFGLWRVHSRRKFPEQVVDRIVV